MNIVGKTASGTLIVEMTSDEWEVRVRPATPMHDPLYRKEIEWADKFENDICQLALETRAHFGLCRAIRCFFWWAENEQTDDTPYKERYRMHLEKRIAVIYSVFGHGDGLLDFESWVYVVGLRRDRLLGIRNVGKKLANDIVEAADKYLCKTGAKQLA